MKDSIFSKVYSYRERENKNSKENFIIEIFAHCLQTDRHLLNDFLKLFEIQSDEETTIKTQPIYDFGRPDIEINIPASKTCILIECKIEHFERLNQLEDYKKILETKNATKRHLVYLTKYYEHRENDNKKIKLHLLKWFDIFQIIDEKNTELSKELKLYIENENMSESKNFTYTDLTVLKNVTGTISKMDELLDGIKEHYELKIGVLSKDSARSTRMQFQWYSAGQVFNHPPNYRFDIDFGITWWYDEIYITAQACLFRAEKYKKTEEYLKLFKKQLVPKNWEFIEDDDYYSFEASQPLAQFIIDEEEQIPAIIKYFKDCIDDLETLLKVNPKIFN